MFPLLLVTLFATSKPPFFRAFAKSAIADLASLFALSSLKPTTTGHSSTTVTNIPHPTITEKILPLPLSPTQWTTALTTVGRLPRKVLRVDAPPIQKVELKSESPKHFAYKATPSQREKFLATTLHVDLNNDFPTEMRMPPAPPTPLKKETAAKPEKKIPPVLPMSDLPPPPPPPAVLAVIPPPPAATPPIHIPNQSKDSPKKTDSSSVPMAVLIPFSHINTLPKSGRIIAIDVESTGIGTGHKITEIACVEMIDGRITGKQFHTLLNPEREVNAEAHQLTGHTWEYLRHARLFKNIVSDLIAFIQGATLVFHGASNDLKWLNESFKSAGVDFTIPKQNIIDTFPIAKQLHPTEKNNLDALCKRYEAYGVGKRKDGIHSALVDAKMLAQAYCTITPKNWFGIAGDIKNTTGEAYFRKMGVQHDLPAAFRFYQELGQRDPTILTAFCDAENNITGVYARNLGDDSQRRFFGSTKGLIDIYPGNPQTVFIGKTISALLARDVLWGEDADSVCNALGITGGFSIKAYLSMDHLPHIPLSKRTKTIVMVMDHDDEQSDADINQEITKSAGHLFEHQLAGLLNKIEQEPTLDLKGFLVRYKQQDWTVVSDLRVKGKRHIQLRRERIHDLIMVVDGVDKTIRIKGAIIENPDTAILVAQPKITVKVVMPRARLASENVSQETPGQLAKRMLTCVNFPKTIDPIDPQRKEILAQVEKKVEQARKIYSSAETTPSASVIKYFNKRGLMGSLPSSFRYLASAYHPWTERQLPVIIAPLMQADRTIKGIHRIFCEPDGTPISDKKHRKVSLGETAFNVFIDIYTGTIRGEEPDIGQTDVGVTFISEGIENALVVRDVIQATAQSNPALARAIYEKLGITNLFNIRSCVGVNGLAEIPLHHDTHTVVFLADNDAYNAEVKQVTINTVRSLLEGNRIVKMVMAKGADGQKIDLNDVYLRPDGTKQIVDLLCDAVTLQSAEELGDIYESLQQSLARIQNKQT